MQWLVCCLLGFAVQPLVAATAQPLRLDTDSTEQISLSRHALIRHLPSGKEWLSKTDNVNFGFSSDVHELEFRFVVHADRSLPDWIFDLGNGRLRHVRLRHFIGDLLIADHRTGTGQSVTSRAIEHHQFVFPIAMRNGEHRLLLEVQSYNSIFILPTLGPQLGWFSTAVANQWLASGLLGTFLMLGLYNLVVFSSTRERVFLLFSISCFAGALWRASDLGLTALYLYPSLPAMYDLVSRFSVGAYAAFLLLFCREFLRVQDYAPKLAQASLYAACLVLVLMLFPIFQHAPSVGLVAIMSCPPFAIAIVVRAKLQKVPGSGLFLFGVVLMTIGGLITAARMQGWLGPVFEFRFAADVSLLAVTILTSVALAARLSEEKLRRELAVAATKAKSLFLANMSHELRTPLNAIVGFSDLLYDSNLADEHKGFARRIDTASKSLLGTISDLLDYSKLEAGQLVIEHKEVELEALVANVHALFERRASDAGLNFGCQLEPGLPAYCLSDELRLTQVLSNLVSNALKFTNQGTVLMRVRPAKRAPNKLATPSGSRWIEFEVRDTGIGLSQEQQAALFVPFAQADASTTRRFGGTGLGLSICKELVERMGGVITLRSQPGRGSCFRFSLCLETCSAPEVVKPQPRLPNSHLAPFQVLVVEDNKTNQMLIRAMLKKSGMAFHLVENGREAIEALHRMRVDMVLMDCQMPQMDGYAATRAIRSELGLAHLPVVALTANASPEDRTRCMEAGMNDFLTKPVRYQQLLAVLHKWAPPQPDSDSEIVQQVLQPELS